MRCGSSTGPGQASGSSSATTPQWGSAPPTQLDRHSASQAYQQQYFGPGSAAQPQPSPNAEPHQTEISLQDNTQVTGYTVDAPPVRSAYHLPFLGTFRVTADYHYSRCACTRRGVCRSAASSICRVSDPDAGCALGEPRRVGPVSRSVAPPILGCPAPATHWHGQSRKSW